MTATGEDGPCASGLNSCRHHRRAGFAGGSAEETPEKPREGSSYSSLRPVQEVGAFLGLDDGSSLAI